MRRIAARLLTQLVRLFRAVLVRLTPRRRRRVRPPALGLVPLEYRDHTGNIVGGIALAGLGFACSDPLDAMALAIGDVALYGRDTGESAPMTAGDPPVPVEKWLPDDLRGLDFPLTPADEQGTGPGNSPNDNDTQFLTKPDDFWLSDPTGPRGPHDGSSTFPSFSQADRTGQRAALHPVAERPGSRRIRYRPGVPTGRWLGVRLLDWRKLGIGVRGVSTRAAADGRRGSAGWWDRRRRDACGRFRQRERRKRRVRRRG